MLYPENLVWLTEERCHGIIIGPVGAYVTLVRYTKGGIEYEVFLENDEFEEVEVNWEDLIEYDNDDD